MEKPQTIDKADKTTLAYSNTMNLLSTSGFTAVDMDIFFAVCAQVAGHEDNRMVFTYSDLMRIIRYKRADYKDFYNDLHRLRAKIGSMQYRGIIPARDGLPPLKEGTLTFFTEFSIDPDYPYLVVVVNKDPIIKGFINHVYMNFTMFDLEVFSQLNSKYAKELYRQLRQWRSLGEHYFKADEFPNVLGVTANYNVGEFTRNVVNPAVHELQKINAFKNLTLDLEREKGRGRKIQKYIFRWSPENQRTNIDKRLSEGELFQWFTELTNDKLSPAELYLLFSEAKNNSRSKEYIEKCWHLSNQEGVRDVVAYMISLLRNGINDHIEGTEKRNTTNRADEYLRNIASGKETIDPGDFLKPSPDDNDASRYLKSVARGETKL